MRTDQPGRSAPDLPLDLTIRGLRRRWKPDKTRLNRLQQSGTDHPLPIRIHRALSWLEAAEQCNTPEIADQRLILLWIAMNAMYGRWDSHAGEPVRDGEALRSFLERILRLDHHQHIARLLHTQRPAVEGLLADKFLNNYLWSNATSRLDGKPDRRVFQARQWYANGAWEAILRSTLERVYFVRCQLVHGAATYGSQLNRDAVNRAADLLDPLLRTLLVVVIDHGVATDWGDLCYPPLSAHRR